jgi:ABC-2 type transport system ATP-binding protein
MANPELTRYLENARAHGMSNEEIMKALSDAGWHVHDLVDIVLDRAKASDENIISARNVVKAYGKMKALDGVSLDVKRGSVTALLGPNGAGKTTLVRIMTTLLKADSGEVSVAGFDVMRQTQQLRSAIGLTGQYAAVDEFLTGRENLEMVARLYHLPSAEAKSRTTDLLKQFALEDAADRPLKTYSGGMRRRLDLAASIIIRPKVLFLDEPTTGLDPRSRFQLWGVIRDLVAEGTTVLLTTQYLEEADQLAHKIFVIDHGKIIAEGTADELKRKVGGDVVELHLADHREAGKAAGLVARFGQEKPHPDEQRGIVTMPVSGGASVLVDVVRELDTAKLRISDVILRRPTLDDVFMKLTGHGAE